MAKITITIEDRSELQDDGASRDVIDINMDIQETDSEDPTSMSQAKILGLQVAKHIEFLITPQDTYETMTYGPES